MFVIDVEGKTLYESEDFLDCLEAVPAIKHDKKVLIYKKQTLEICAFRGFKATTLPEIAATRGLVYSI